MRPYRPGDRVVSIAVMGLGEGIIYDTHWDGVEVIWSDGQRSSERYQDLVYAGHVIDWKDLANQWTGNRDIFGAEGTNLTTVSFTNQLETMWDTTIPAGEDVPIVPKDEIGITLNVPATFIGYSNVSKLKQELQARSMATYLLEMRQA